MSGVFGDLSDRQQNALDLFKSKIRPSAEDLDGDSIDHLSLRYLRARKFDVAAALHLYNMGVQHRSKTGIKKILNAKLPKAEYFKRLVPHAFHGHDKEGRPIYIEKLGKIDFPTALKYMTYDELMVHHMWQMEYQIKRCRESSKRRGDVVDTVCTVVDLKGLSMRGRKGVHLMKLFSQHDSTYHPERLGKVYLLNAPWVFPFFWKLCSVFLDERTISKIHVLGKNYQAELLQYIDADQLPVEYGGTCTCSENKDGCIPVSDISDLMNTSTEDVLFDDVEPTEIRVAARDSHEEKFDVPKGGACFDWAFLSSKDVKFSLLLVRGSETKEIFPEQRVTKHKGSYTSKQAGTFVLKFDNGFSRWTSKAIKYSTSITPLKTEGVEEKKLAVEEPADFESLFQIDVADAVPDVPRPNEDEVEVEIVSERDDLAS